MFSRISLLNNKQSFVSVVLAVIASVVVAVGIGYAATAIGTNISVDGNLTVSGTAATSTLSTGGFAVGTNQFVVQQTSGSVGIGTTSPAQLLSVAGNSFFGNGSASTLTYNAGQFTYAQNATSTIPGLANAWSIATSTSATPIISVTVNNNSTFGQVGINTIETDGFQFTVGGVSPALKIKDNSTTTQRVLVQSFTDGTDRLVFFGIGGRVRYDLGLEPEFGTDSFAIRNETLGVTNFVLNGITGNLGIGTTSPAQLLSVAGDAYIAGTGTTTLNLKTTTASKGTCIEMFDSSGAVNRLYVNPDHTLKVEAGTCK